MPITSAFGYHTRALEVVEGLDLSGKRALVTGGAAGIGAETTRALAAAGAEVIVAVRNPAQGESFLSSLDESLRTRVTVTHLDLADLASARGLGEAVSSDGRPLHILINNAGIMATPFGHTANGFESQFGTNHLGHFVLTAAILPALRRAEGARVVVLSSSAHRRSDVDILDPNFLNRPYDKWVSYGQSKTANALFAVELTKRYGGDGIFANAVMPGGIMTGLQKHMPLEEQRAAGFTDENGEPNPMFKSTEQGASTSVWAAVGHELDGIGGRYLENCQEAGPMDLAMPFMGVMPYALDSERAAAVWALSVQLIGENS